MLLKVPVALASRTIHKLIERSVFGTLLTAQWNNTNQQ